MNAKQAKQINIIHFLQQLGHLPLKSRGQDFWFLSPLRIEKTPSFKVNNAHNIWFDFGTGTGGNIIDLAKIIYNTNDIAQTLKRLNQTSEVPPPPLQINNNAIQQPQPTKPFTVSHLKHPALLQYLQDRSLNLNIAKQFLMQANQDKFFYIAFPNDRQQGYELRNKFYKGATSKAVSSIFANPTNGRTPQVNIFEGFIDFLSYLTLKDTDRIQYDTIVLNSIVFIPNILDKITEYQQINLFLDNDEQGINAVKYFEPQKTKNCAHYYQPYKDINDYLQHRRNAPKFKP